MHSVYICAVCSSKFAKGDFSLRLDNTYPEHEPVGVLVKSMNDMALELNAMENMRQEFISNVSHEIQSPLTSIRGFAQALENDHLSLEERHHYLDIIENESTRLSRIAEDPLRLASLESRRLAVQPKNYRLDKQMRNLILACDPQWTSREIDMDVALEEAEITADALQHISNVFRTGKGASLGWAEPAPNSLPFA